MTGTIDKLLTYQHLIGEIKAICKKQPTLYQEILELLEDYELYGIEP